MKFCTGVDLPRLLLAVGLQAPSGVAGVVVLGLSTGLLPEDSLQHFKLRNNKKKEKKLTFPLMLVSVSVSWPSES